MVPVLELEKGKTEQEEKGRRRGRMERREKKNGGDWG